MTTSPGKRGYGTSVNVASPSGLSNNIDSTRTWTSEESGKPANWYWRFGDTKDKTIAPARKLANEKPKGETVDYDTLVKSWPATPPKRAEAK